MTLPSPGERVLPRPSLVAVLGLMAGQGLARGLALGNVALAIAVFAGLVLTNAALRGRADWRGGLMALLFAGAGLVQGAFLENSAQTSRGAVARLEAHPSDPIVVRGTVAGDPRVRGEDSLRLWLAPGALVFRGEAAEVLATPVPLFLRLGDRGADRLANLAPGDRIEARGAMVPVGQGDSFDEWLDSQGAALWVKARYWEVQPGERTLWDRYRLATRRWADGMEALFHANTSHETAAVLSAISLGRTGQLSDSQREAFSRSGLLHLFAVSGLHAGIVAGLTVWLATFLGLGPRRRAWLVVIAMVLFCSVTGFRPSVMRASLLAIVFVGQPLLGRSVDPLGALASVALLLMLANPRAMWQVDFQMTFLAAGALLMAAPGAIALRERLGPKVGWSRWGGFLIGGLQVAWVSLWIQLALAPILVGVFGRVSLIAPLSNVVAAPCLPFLLGGAFVAGLLDGVWAEGAGGLVWLTGYVAEALAGIAGVLSAAPFAAVEADRDLPGWAMGLFYLALLAGRWVRLRPRFTPFDGLGSAALGGAVAAGLLVFTQTLRPPEPMLRVTFLDVGQGDAILLQASSGETMLVDAGPPRGPDLARELAELGVRRLDVLVLTHADADHIGGAEELLMAFPVDRVVVGSGLAETETWLGLNRVFAYLEKPVLQAQRGTAFTLGNEVRVRVLHPIPEFTEAGDDRNDASIVLRVEAGAVAFLLTGDAEAEAEREMLAALDPGDLHCDVLKAGHHGSDSSSSMPFLMACQPRWAVISCGRQNRYGHPHMAVLARMAEVNAAVLRTDKDGSISFTTDGRSVVAERQRPAAAGLAR
ncbi:MAG: DNA internalization-related competence protein ComEC/Rec2 [Sumerlaeia bacterium]